MTAREKLRGRTSGRNREALIEFATVSAANYYQIPPEQVIVELENVFTLSEYDTDYASLGRRRYITGYEGDFTAEVVES